jgi:amidase
VDLDLGTVSAVELLDAMVRGELSALELTEHCLARIVALDSSLNAIVATDPTALDQARAADARRATRQARPLDGLPILIKDNIAVAGLPTTAGSLALANSRPPDAPLVGRLRSAGAIVLAKTNLSEWANFRSLHSASGWSAIGGQTHNPHVLDRNPSGSSSGSAAGVAAGFAPLAIGTETDGSIVSPAGACGVVGFKPTLGSVPGAGIIPISSAQDVAGPMTRTVADAAAVYAVISGEVVPGLRAEALEGRRIGVWSPDGLGVTADVLAGCVATLSACGATTVAVRLETAEIEAVEWPALLTEFRDELDRYLASAPGSAVTGLAELIAFNAADDLELELFGQDNLETALAAVAIDDPAYLAQRAAANSLARAQLDAALVGQRLDAIVTVSNSPAWLTEYGRDEQFPVSTSTPAAVAGYPTISVPAGFIGALPIGVSFIASAGADARLLSYAYAFEQATAAWRAPRMLPTVS